MEWPNDPDGDVFRLLNSQGFDFAIPHTVEFNVDFETWPPSEESLSTLQSLVGEVDLFAPDEHGPGFAQFRFRELVTYDWVTRLQNEITGAMKEFGGRCESWGVMG